MKAAKDAPTLSRRRAFAGAGAVGAAAAAAAMLPRALQPVAPVAVAAEEATGPQGGYQETAHVLRYYQTTRV